MNDAVATVLAIALLFISLPVVVLYLRDRASAARKPRAREAERRAHGQRLLNPDWRGVERHLGRPAPLALREMYADRALIASRDLQWPDDCLISSFEPLDAPAMAAANEWLGFAAVAIATTDVGDAVYLRCGPEERETVYITHHDGGDTAQFAESVAVMHATLRNTNPRIPR